MSAIRGIISTHRTRMESAGLMRQVTARPLPEHIQRIASPHFRALAVLRECPDRLRVERSPMAVLFEQTLPQLEPLLIELGEAKAENIISRLCEHGRTMIEKYEIEGSKEHLEGLFKDLPEYEEKIREEQGIEEIVEAYRQVEFEGRGEGYLRLKLEGKILDLQVDRDGRISLQTSYDVNDLDVISIGRAKNIKKLDLLGFSKRKSDSEAGRKLMELLNISEEAGVSDISPLSALADLEELSLSDTEVHDLAPLSGLVRLRKLALRETRVSDLQPLSGLKHLQELDLSRTRISDLAPLKGLRSLRKLDISLTSVTDLAPLSELVNLRELSLEATAVIELAPLKNLSGLQRLSLLATQVKKLTPLKGLAGLQILDLTGTPVSDAQVRMLQKALPGLEVMRDDRD